MASSFLKESPAKARPLEGSAPSLPRPSHPRGIDSAMPSVSTALMPPLLRFFLLLFVFGSFSLDAAPKKKASPTPTAKPKKAASASASPKQAATPEPSAAPGELKLAAVGATVIDGVTGLPIYAKNPDQRLFPASATKILTALLIIEEGNLDAELTVELPDTQVEPSSLGIKVGEKYVRREMLYGLMLKSANDVAQALARDNAGSVALFGEKMTQRAHELGATSSNFKNPHGLHHKEHYTTAHDLALIARAAMDQPLFREVVATRNRPWRGNPHYPEVVNKNKLLVQYPGCTGIKTGYTRAAQQVLVSSALRGGREVISVVLHTNRPGIWEDSKALLTHGFANLPSYLTEL